MAITASNRDYVSTRRENIRNIYLAKSVFPSDFIDCKVNSNILGERQQRGPEKDGKCQNQVPQGRNHGLKVSQ